MNQQKKPTMNSRILLVDDESLFCELLENGLKKINPDYNITTVTDPMDVEDLVIRNNIDLILTDIKMPNQNGIDLMKNIRKIRHEISFIFITGHGEMDSAIAAIKYGALDYIRKPCTVEDVHLAIEKAERIIDLNRRLHIDEQIFRNTFHLSPHGMILLNYNGIIMDANQSFLNDLGYTSFELLNKSIETIVHPDELNEFIRSRESFINSDESAFNEQRRFIGRNNDIQWFELRFSKIRNLEHHDSIIFLHLINITKPQKEYKIRELLQTLSDAIHTTRTDWEYFKKIHELISEIILAPNFYIATYNPALKTIQFPYFCDEMDDPPPSRPLGNSLTDYVIRRKKNLILNQVELTQFITRLELESHGTIPSSWVGVSLAVDSEILGMIGIQSYQKDITYNTGDLEFLELISEQVAYSIKRKMIQSRLEMLYTAIEQSTDSVMITDDTGSIQFVNKSFEKLTGYSLSEVKSQNPRILRSEQHDESFYTEMWETILRGDTWQGQIINQKKGGELYHEFMSITPVFNSLNQLVNFVAVKRDISKEMQRESQLRQAQKMEAIGQLAAGIAHEINTPIQYISDYLYFLKDTFFEFISQAAEGSPDLPAADDGLKEDIEMALNHSMEGTEKVAEIVRAMREFSHPGVKEKQLRNVNNAISNTVKVTRNEWKYTCKVQLSLDPELPAIPLLESEFNQVVLNLIMNSVDAIKEKIPIEEGINGLIEISTGVADDFVSVSVTDNGIGIPDTVLPHIFEPFYTTKEVGKGTGQGLAIIYHIVTDKHGGRISCESMMGTGTTFSILLPVNPEK